MNQGTKEYLELEAKLLKKQQDLTTIVCQIRELEFDEELTKQIDTTWNSLIDRMESLLNEK